MVNLSDRGRPATGKSLPATDAVDVLRCGRCGGRLRVLAAITEKATAKKILAHLGFPTEPIVARPRARDPAEFWAGTALSAPKACQAAFDACVAACKP